MNRFTAFARDERDERGVKNPRSKKRPSCRTEERRTEPLSPVRRTVAFGARVFNPSRKCLLLALPALFLALVATSCSGGDDAETGIGVEVRRNQSRWTARSIANYRYTLQLFRFAPPGTGGPVVIEVRNGVRTAITAANPGDPAPDPAAFARYDTIDKLFGILRDALDRNAARIDARFDPAYSFPRSASIDYSLAIADEELGFDVSGFEVLP